ncbi:hypothetical protein BCR33DRAFT_139391 [Rhizoclosmatium globosum]|uniref:Uncharacterized protein n=1 Tax=Rhizoclosmatium globosum TaxID=329046 RepID=A0A1Y2AKA1_9FUNG|nr:hypothetical protein BCR33DRAFT_139391 [Rhizoclosmatium globosum]|eukprot:ORY22998.1 hypothetical protein BCR33DRAFT_139391 [Rhizoclosmatium globosum]
MGVGASWGTSANKNLQPRVTSNSSITASLDSLPSTTKPVLLFRLDSIDQLSLPETQPVTINMTLTLANTTTITIPPITVTSTEHPIPIDFECSFHLPQEHPSPPLDITIRVAPVMSLGTEIKRASPLVSTSSRSIALPNIFKTKAGSGTSAKNSKAGLPLGGLSTRGVLIDNVKRFAEVDCPRRVGERSWTAEFGEGRVGMRVHVKGVSILMSERRAIFLKPSVKQHMVLIQSYCMNLYL